MTSLGHCHPDVTAAIIAQAQSIIHVQCAIALSEPYVQLVESLLTMMPDPSLDSFFFWNSGSEAVEAAIKVVRSKTRRNNIVVMQGGYHGRTSGAAALTRSKTSFFKGSGPLMVCFNKGPADCSLVSIPLHSLTGILWAYRKILPRRNLSDKQI